MAYGVTFVVKKSENIVALILHACFPCADEQGLLDLEHQPQEDDICRLMLDEALALRA
jgi:hypothetical protein